MAIRADRPLVLGRQRRPVGLAVPAGLDAAALRTSAGGCPGLWLTVRGDRVRSQLAGTRAVHTPPRLTATLTPSGAPRFLDGAIREHTLTAAWPTFYLMLGVFCLVAAAQRRATHAPAALAVLVLAGVGCGFVALVFGCRRRARFDRDVTALLSVLQRVLTDAGR